MNSRREGTPVVADVDRSCTERRRLRYAVDTALICTDISYPRLLILYLLAAIPAFMTAISSFLNLVLNFFAKFSMELKSAISICTSWITSVLQREVRSIRLLAAFPVSSERTPSTRALTFNIANSLAASKSRPIFTPVMRIVWRRANLWDRMEDFSLHAKIHRNLCSRERGKKFSSSLDLESRLG